MPIGFFYAPALFQYKGVTIYGIFKNDDSRNELRADKYGWSELSSDDGEDSFYLTDLLNYDEHKEPIEIIKEAIERGWITNEHVVTKWNQKEKGSVYQKEVV